MCVSINRFPVEKRELAVEGSMRTVGFVQRGCAPIYRVEWSVAGRRSLACLVYGTYRGWKRVMCYSYQLIGTQSNRIPTCNMCWGDITYRSTTSESLNGSFCYFLAATNVLKSVKTAQQRGFFINFKLLIYVVLHIFPLSRSIPFFEVQLEIKMLNKKP